MSSKDTTLAFRSPRLSVLDLVPVRSDQTSPEAIAASRALAGVADRLGYARYWVAEHHNMPAVASTSPPLVVALLAGATERIRVGSGGVLLPNHAPLVLAEQFALLEAAFPGRIDLGVGRSAGGDLATSRALGRHTGSVEDLLAAMAVTADGRPVAGGRPAPRATPRAVSVPAVWVLGASSGSARMAGEQGLPYVFGYHLGVDGAAEALATYRSAFRPSAGLAEPRTLLPVRASVAATHDEAYRAALPWLLVMLGLLTGRPQAAVGTIEEALDVELPATDQRIVDAMARQYVIGTADEAGERLDALAAQFGVDEVMIHPVGSARDGADPRTTPAAEETLRLLAANRDWT